MKTLPGIFLSFLVGFAAAYYYVALQNTAAIAYNSGGVDAMVKMCPSLVDKFKSPAPAPK